MMRHSEPTITGKSQKFTKRQMRAFGIVIQGGQIHKIDNGHYKVQSQTSDRTYNVVFEASKWSCNCPDFGKSLKPCKHLFAVQYYLKLPHIMQANGYGRSLGNGC